MSLAVGSPVPGKTLPMSKVPDAVFSAALVGPGVAVDPARGGRLEVVSPVHGRLIKLHPHAFVVQALDGAGVLVHLGIDTVQLKGAGFELLAAEGVEVAAGQPIVAWDPDGIQAAGRSPLCPVVALDAAPSALTDIREDDDVAAGDTLFTWLC